MKVSLKWLSDYVDIPEDVSALCDRLDLTGTGVEEVKRTGEAFEKVVCGRIAAKDKHPDSDHLWVCTVDVGLANTDEAGNPAPLQIVCGAQNFNAGDHVPVALVGAVLPGDVHIKKSKLRGVVSYGMNCSERELGMGSDHSGIMILSPDAPVGMDFADYMKLNDTVLDLEITPNRPDCLSVTGLAREIAAVYQTEFRDPLPADAAKLQIDASARFADEYVSLEIESAQRCPRYSARVIRNCKVGPSPRWLVERLEAIGQRSINNVVDVTNYILFLYGQPLHSFDMDSLQNDEGKVRIVVRAAKPGERFTTLDGVDRVLNEDMTVISTPEKGVVALAGVMGGLESEVTADTTNILLEAATFEAGRCSRTSRSLGLMSESSLRYERQVDDHGIDERSAAAAALIAELAGGTVSPVSDNDRGIVDEWVQVSSARSLTFRMARFRAMMGSDIDSSFARDVLERLGCSVSLPEVNSKEEVLEVIPPTFRPDLEREIDLYEEVLRLWGMDRIAPTLPGGRGRFGVRSEGEKVLATLNTALRGCGLNETMTYSFASPQDILQFGISEAGLESAVELLNPLNAEQSYMRQSIIPGLLRSVSYNQSRGVRNVALYESGVVFFARQGHKKPREKQHLAAVMAGSMDEASWNASHAPFDFFDAKGVVENIARELAIPKLRFKLPAENEFAFLQPGRGAVVFSGGAVLGWVGELHPSLVKSFEATAPVVAFELDMDALYTAHRAARDYREVSVFPAVSMDVAFVVDESLSCEKVVQTMRNSAGALLEDIRLFDVYRDDARLGIGKKSMAFALSYRAPDRTLTGEEALKLHTRVVRKVCASCGAEVRA